MVTTRQVRIASQTLTFGLWVALILVTKHPIENALTRNIPVSLFLRMDPLVTTVVSGGMRMLISITMLGFVTLAISLVMGRVFCGWVCPLGTVFDFVGWWLRKFRIKFEGPSPWYFRFKYYLLAATLILAAAGAVHPLMGFDPIVIITRVAATLINPFLRAHDEILWATGDSAKRYGMFIDVATLVLFVLILGATTRLSRIWCRVACPLGAYLAVSSRYSMLRRDTVGCVHCGICANHCPTGAINFENAEIYNESECIKCFACTQECPVDANFFTWKSPLPVTAHAHHPVSLDRRAFIGTAAAAVVAAPALNLAAGKSSAEKTLLRPPMSREERDFLLSCIRCNNCTKSCPTGILKPAVFEHGVRAFWSPVMVPTEGLCEPGCNACSQACPTDAIMKYPIEDKYRFKMGTAVFESNRCVAYTENKFCNECVRVCPTDAIAVIPGWEPETKGVKRGADVPAPPGQTPSRPERVHFEACVACGACENVCDKIVYGEPAMVTTSFGRAVPTVLDEKYYQRLGKFGFES